MKETVLKALRQGGYVSGAELGKLLGVSRTAVWKCIRAFRCEGYLIDSSTAKGYLLVGAPDSLLPEEIKAELKTSCLGQKIVYHRRVASTQNAAKILAEEGASEGTTVVAETQTEGRGRIGRVWASPPGGIYLSVILRPDIRPSDVLRFPLIAGVAVAQAIELVTGIEPKLKWPNDIIVGGKKAGGILAEMSAEMDRVNYIIIGIGINVNTDKARFGRKSEWTATSLKEECGKEVPRAKLVQDILAQLESLYEDCKRFGFEPIRRKWKALSNTIGSQVSISIGKERLKGEAIDIDEEGALILRGENRTLHRIVAGDVRLIREE